MLARDIMRKRVVTVSPDMTVREAAKLFVGRGISGAPVVNSASEVVGVVSQTDIVRCDGAAHEGEEARFYGEEEKIACDRNFHVETPDFTRVSEVMTPVVISFEEDAPVELIARKMLERRVHRVIITRGRKVRGIVTTMDMLRALVPERAAV